MTHFELVYLHPKKGRVVMPFMIGEPPGVESQEAEATLVMVWRALLAEARKAGS